jgi:hypothetical protein
MIVAIHMCSLIQYIIPSLVLFVNCVRLVNTCPLVLLRLSGGALYIFAPQAHLHFFSISSTLRELTSHSSDLDLYLLFFPSSRSLLL